MARRERLHLPTGMSVETFRDWNGRGYIAYAKGASMFFREPAEVRRFLKLPKGTTSRESLDSWIASLELADRQRGAGDPQPEVALTDEQLATGFGPECHLDESDPNYATRTIT